MTQQTLHAPKAINEAFQALQQDLADEKGPRISTMRNYRFAIVPYSPEHEFLVRRKIAQLDTSMQASGWTVLTISLQTLMLDRIEAMGSRVVSRLIEREKTLSEKDAQRSRLYIQDKISRQLEGPEGLAGDIATLIDQTFAQDANAMESGLILLTRASALYPFMRLSALLKHLDGRTSNIPVVLFYPGHRTDDGLSFMGIMPPDRDYRPRIYP